MALITRRQFVQQTAFATTALYGCPIELLTRARSSFEKDEQNAAPPDTTAIRKLGADLAHDFVEQGPWTSVDQPASVETDVYREVIPRWKVQDESC